MKTSEAHKVATEAGEKAYKDAIKRGCDPYTAASCGETARQTKLRLLLSTSST